jgi:hypothetical protein
MGYYKFDTDGAYCPHGVHVQFVCSTCDRGREVVADPSYCEHGVHYNIVCGSCDDRNRLLKSIGLPPMR